MMNWKKCTPFQKKAIFGISMLVFGGKKSMSYCLNLQTSTWIPPKIIHGPRVPNVTFHETLGGEYTELREKTFIIFIIG